MGTAKEMWSLYLNYKLSIRFLFIFAKLDLRHKRTCYSLTFFICRLPKAT